MTKRYADFIEQYVRQRKKLKRKLFSIIVLKILGRKLKRGRYQQHSYIPVGER